MEVHYQIKEELPKRVKFGYTMGQFTDSLSYNLFYFFFLLFLTDVVGIPAATAGSIILIAVLWDAVTDPIIGNISDMLTLKSGRRRPLMLGALLPFAVMVFLLYANLEFLTPTYKSTYFMIVTILFWSAYKTFVIPFFALGAEITNDFNERTSLRVWASYGIYGSVLIATSLPPMVVSFSEAVLGTNDSGGWMVVGGLFAFLTLVTGLICWRITRGREVFIQKHVIGSQYQKDVNKNIIIHFFEAVLHTMRSLFKLSAARYLALSVFFWSGASAMGSGTLIYLMDRNLHYSAEKISLSFIIFSLISLAWLPVINIVSRRFDKRSAYYIAMGVSGLIVILFYFIGFAHIGMLIIYLIFFGLGNSFFWTIYYSMMYDISELDEFVSGRRREGAIAAIMSFTQKAGAAVAVWIVGLILGWSGYDGIAEIQPESANRAILSLTTWIPGVIGLLAAIAAFIYPLTRVRFHALMVVLEAKREGESYQLNEEINKLLK